MTNTTAALTWFQLSAQANPGDRVRFVTPHDIFPHALVEAGEMATVIENSLNELHCGLYLLPDNPALREKLQPWEGQIYLPPADLGRFDTDPNSGSLWYTESPITITDKLSERQIVGKHEGGESFDTTLKTFLTDNDGFTPDEIADIAIALAGNAPYVGGGGAAPVFQLSLVHDLGKGWEAFTSRDETGKLELSLCHETACISIDLDADATARLRAILNA